MRKKLFSLFALLLMAVTGAWADVSMQETPLTLEAKTAGTIVVSNPQSGMQYSLNGGAKTAVTADPIAVEIGDKVAFFGDGTSITSYFSDDSDTSNDTRIVGGTAECYIYGNIMSLVDEENFKTATELTGANTFRALFYGNTTLYNHESFDLVLPATKLTEGCYRGMFYDCTGLTSVPVNVLPATELANYCYRSMFSGCTGLAGLNAIPGDLLPATTLAESCYTSMFYNCTNLTTVPTDLLQSATTLANSCCQSMFSGCTSLTSAPELPATTLADVCYRSMFMKCTSLETAPTILPATELAYDCYHDMFYGCSSLTTAPELPATTLAYNCYRSMFNGCTSLTSAPELPAKTLASSSYNAMFKDCTSLNAITCLATDISASDATTNWLEGVTGTFIKATSMTGWPSNTSGIPSGMTVKDYDKVTPLTLEAKTAGTIVVSSPKSGMQYSLNGGDKAAVPASITVAVGDKVQFFGNGTSITSYDGTSITGGTAECYIYGNIMSLVNETAFEDATTLTGADAFSGLFNGNTRLFNHGTNVLLLPATTLTNACYQDMFQGCTGLTTAPELPATTLADNCYNNMFSGCTSLNVVTCYATNISATDATTNWLYNVAATGTFTKAPSMTAWTTGVNGIPSGWISVADMKTVPLTLEAKTAGTIVIANPQSGMKYSKNGGEKTNVSGDIEVAIGDKVQFFGNGTSITSYYTSDENFTNIAGGDADCYIYGNIMSLVDETGFETATTLTGDNAFRNLFNGNTLLLNHASNELILPAATLTTGCYYGMFQGCTGLTSAPALPATKLATYCYNSMFSGCTGLTSAPALPAKGLITSCYRDMFSGCTSLTSVPALPATALATYCYYAMFSGCTGLTSVPADLLPVKTVVDNCYREMFSGCTSLTSVPELPATKLDIHCYRDMFSGCTSLTSAPELPATTLKTHCYDSMFSGCTSLTSVPELPAPALSSFCYRGMFSGCTSLETVPANLLQVETLADSCYSSMFNGCTSLTSAPALPATTLAAGCYRAMFNGCSSLAAAPALPATTLKTYCYHQMFHGCTSLTTAPELPATTLSTYCYAAMFSGCTSLETAPELPATTLQNYCYQSMFYGCTSLETAPELPATTLATGCYYSMFNGCSNLNSVTCLATTISATNSHKNWLSNVKSTGTFTKASAMTGWPTSASGIPSGWTVANKAILNDNNNIASQLTAGQTCTVEYSREFTASKPSTVCLPFAYEMKTGEKFYEFTGVEKDGEGNFVATMTAYSGANLVANTPYLYVPASTGATDFSGTYTLPAEITAGTTVSSDWTFVGTYTTLSWDDTPHPGIYGFSAQAVDGISQGEFVKVGAYVRVKPMRSYLMYKNSTEDYHDASVRSFSGVPSTLSEPLPERIKVRFVDADGEVTGIGMLDTQTGDVNFDSEAWYTLDGVRLTEKPTKQGIYVNNGKKVIVK